MPTLRDIRGHIGSVRGVAKVTRAMELVSVAKRQRLQARLASTRAFSRKSWEVLQHIAGSEGFVGGQPELRGYERVERVAVVLITSSRGMVGRYDDDIISLALRFLATLAPAETQFITIGRVGRDAMMRLGHTVHADFSTLDDHATIDSMTPVTHVLLDGFHSGLFQRACIAYSSVPTALRVQPLIRDLLPVRVAAPAVRREYIYEPAPSEILRALIPRILRFQIYEAFLDGLTSENAARAAAMRTASRNAEELIRHLSLTYNKARQQSITSELLDVIRGRYADQPRGSA